MIWKWILLLLIPACAFGQDSVESDVSPRVLFAQGDYETVIAVLTDSLRVNSTEDSLYLALSYQSLLQHEKAIQVLEPLATSTGSRGSTTALGRSYVSLGQPEKAVPLYEAAVEADSTDRVSRLGLAELYTRLDSWDKAAIHYRKLLESDKENGTLYARLGRCYENLGETEEAVIAYERARRLNPNNPNLLFTLINVYYAREEYISALRVADSGISTFPDEPRFQKRKGDVLNHQERFQEAIDAFDRAIALGDTSNANLLRNKGIAHYSMTDYAGAVAALDESYRLEDTDEVTAFYLGISYQGLQDFENAHRYLTAARRIMLYAYPVSMVNYMVQLGATYAMERKYAEAKETYESLRGMDPDHVDVLFHLAVLNDEFDRYETALKYFQEFVENTNGNPGYRIYAEGRIPALQEIIHFNR